MPAYCTRRVQAIRILYVLMIILWLFIVAGIGLIPLINTAFMEFMVILPIILFLIAIYNASKVTEETEQEMMRTNLLSITLVVALPLLTWIASDMDESRQITKRTYKALIITALVLTLFSLFDIWLPNPWITVEKHMRSAFQTLSLNLLVIALYIYYIHEQ